MNHLFLAARARIAGFKGKYFSESLDFRARIFNTLALVGIHIGLILAGLSVFTRAGAFNTALTLLASVLGLFLFVLANRTGRFQLCYIITVVAVFFLLFPLLFFSAGGFRSGMPSFFVFAVVFTVLMLQGKMRLAITALELFLYLVLCLIAYVFPETVTEFPSAYDEAKDMIFGFFAASVALAVVISQHIRVYDSKQERLEHVDQLKNELIGNISHELKTPLTVISMNIQTASDMLASLPDCERPRELLINSQSEIMRLSRLVGGTLNLAAIGGDGEKRIIDIGRLLEDSAEPWRLPLKKKGNNLHLDIAGDLPKVYVQADLFTQVIANLLHNSNAHTADGDVTISAKRSRGKVLVNVSDTGSGIAEDLLSRVFARGVSGSGGTGYGLYFCKTAVETHGGEISIESRVGKGTAVSFVIPPYEGQRGFESP